MKVINLILALVIIMLVSTAATCQTTNHYADLSWTAGGGTGVTGYNVYRADGKLCVDNPTFVKVGFSSTTTYHDPNLVANTKYAYVVRTTDGTNESANSNCSDGTTLKDPLVPPGSLTVVPK